MRRWATRSRPIVCWRSSHVTDRLGGMGVLRGDRRDSSEIRKLKMETSKLTDCPRAGAACRTYRRAGPSCSLAAWLRCRARQELAQRPQRAAPSHTSTRERTSRHGPRTPLGQRPSLALTPSRLRARVAGENEQGTNKREISEVGQQTSTRFAGPSKQLATAGGRTPGISLALATT